MKLLSLRLWQMLLGWGSVGIVYHFSDRWQAPGRLMAPGWVDQLIPFSPQAIWLYLSFFLLIPCGYLLTPLSTLPWLRRAMQLAALGAGMVYMLWPTTMVYPKVIDTGLSARLLTLLTQFDSAQNCLPSLHMALSLLAVWAIAKARHKGLTILALLWALLIGFSILQLRRHLFVDVLAGTALALAAGVLAQAIGQRRLRATGDMP
ncbi:phosphatase PAP2 family protein [Comamonas sp. GB3 AK4-5]|uniref:phosphatase PAP2 family protein n=1 Tax=Comamonas sp. GB3 AK4-5 TaxID=3231487 RepID=UPI00351E8007